MRFSPVIAILVTLVSLQGQPVFATTNPTGEQCQIEAQEQYDDCIRALPDGPISPIDEGRCRKRADEKRNSCIDAINADSTAPFGKPTPPDNKKGCYCYKFNDQSAVNNVALQGKVLVQEMNLPRICGDKQKQDGFSYTECEWFGPDPEAPTAQDKRRLFDQGLGGKISNLNQVGNITPQQLIGRAIKTAMGIIGTIALVILVVAGLLWMTAAGNADREKKAMNMMFWGALGVIVVLGAYAIVTFILENAFVQ